MRKLRYRLRGSLLTTTMPLTEGEHEEFLAGEAKRFDERYTEEKCPKPKRRLRPRRTIRSTTNEKLFVWQHMNTNEICRVMKLR